MTRRILTAAVVSSGLLLAVVSVAACGSGTRPAHVQLSAPRPLQRAVRREIVTATARGGPGLSIVGTSAGRVYVLPTNGSGIPRLLVSLPDKIMNIAISDGGATIAAVSVDGGVAVKQTTGHVLKGRLDLSPESVAFDAAARQIAFAGLGVKTFDVATGTVMGDYDQPGGPGGRGTYEGVAFARGQSLVAASVEGVDRWRLGHRHAVAPTRLCNCGADGVTLSGDGGRAVFGTADGHMIVMDTASGQVLADTTVSGNLEDHVFAVGADHSGRLVVGFAASGRGALWDARENHVVWRGTLRGLFPSKVTFVGDTQMLVQSQTNASDNGTGFGLAPWLVSMSSS